MPFHQLAHLANSPLHLRLIVASGESGAEVNLSLACVASVFQRAAKLLAVGRLQVEILSLQQAAELDANSDLASAKISGQICLLLADADTTAPDPAQLAAAIALCVRAEYWGASGAAVLWLAQAGRLDDLQVALAWPLMAEIDSRIDNGLDNKLDSTQFNSNLYGIDRQCITCCGGAASLDFALSLVLGLYGHPLQSKLKDVLNIEQERAGTEKQRQGAQAKALPPKLTEVLALMQANIEEPLSSDDLANLVDISRRQLERLFKQYLGNLPSRYYLEMRLQKARALLLESHHSIVQIGLMCGFSSGSHFSTAFSALYGITPREERQRKMNV